MESSYDTIKTRLKTILQSERTIEFLNKLTDFGISLGNSPQINNKFIKEVFQGEGIEIKNKNNRKSIINNIIIDNKKILLRTISISNKFINFKSFKYERQDQIDFSNLKEKINNDLDNLDYLFLIRIEEEYNEEFDELKAWFIENSTATEISRFFNDRFFYMFFSTYRNINLYLSYKNIFTFSCCKTSSYNSA